jgi:hypothetical protein
MTVYTELNLMIISDYTVIYTCNSGVRREMYIKAKDVRQATLSAQELIPKSCTLTRVYHDPEFN